MREEKLTGFEGGALIVYGVFAAYLVALPGGGIAQARNAAWITVPLAGGVAIALGLLLERMARGRGLVEIGRVGFGRPLLFALGAVFLLMAIRSARAATESTLVYALPSVNRISLCLLYVSVTLYTCVSGISALGRAARIALPLSVGIYALVLICASLEEWTSATAFFPILGTGPADVLAKAQASGGFFLAMLFPLVEAGRFTGNRKKTIWRAVLVVTGLTTAGFAAHALASPVPNDALVFSPLIDLASLVSVGHFVQRLSAPFMLVWVVALLASATAFSYYAARCIAQSFGVEEHKYVLVPIAAATYSVAVLTRSDTPGWLNAALDVFSGWGLLLFAPALLLLLLGIIRTGGKKRAQT